uniref:(northern house mosquito) hypothetical protein n=1 Tax=Culex pipiens TaxID=7175 RepID=A0A8D8K2F2_CULPI
MCSRRYSSEYRLDMSSVRSDQSSNLTYSNVSLVRNGVYWRNFFRLSADTSQLRSTNSFKCLFSLSPSHPVTVNGPLTPRYSSFGIDLVAASRTFLSTKFR